MRSMRRANNNAAATTTPGVHTTHKARPSSMLVHAFSLLNLCVFVVLTAVAGHLYAGLVENKAPALRVFARATNASYTLLIALVAGAVGISTTLFSLLQFRDWSELTRVASMAINIITLALVTLGSASAGRSMRSGQSNGPNSSFDQLRVMYGLLYTLMILQLGYVIALGVTRVHTHVLGHTNTVGHPGVVNTHTTSGTTAATTGSHAIGHKTVDVSPNGTEGGAHRHGHAMA